MNVLFDNVIYDTTALAHKNSNTVRTVQHEGNANEKYIILPKHVKKSEDGGGVEGEGGGRVKGHLLREKSDVPS